MLRLRRLHEVENATEVTIWKERTKNRKQWKNNSKSSMPCDHHRRIETYMQLNASEKNPFRNPKREALHKLLH